MEAQDSNQKEAAALRAVRHGYFVSFFIKGPALIGINTPRSAGVCAAIKTSKLRTVTKKTDITCKLPLSVLDLTVTDCC